MLVQYATPTIVRFDNDPHHFGTSVYVNRLEALLAFSNSSHELGSQPGNPKTSPRGKLPYIKLGQEMIPDSLFGYEELIRRDLASELDVGLFAKELGISRAITSLVEEIYLHFVIERFIHFWLVILVLSRANSRYACLLLWLPLRMIIASYVYRLILSRRCALDLERPADEIDSVRRTALDALATWVGHKTHLLAGDPPTRVDTIVFGLIATVHADPR
ncbi:hypothetical protein DL93DRAFT_2166684 [Clavulina sp. PMI_390]|nr:hypothetical protein DL93DRAFT_2166684 [Clavulina sp. PMI_390]